ncbi:protein ubiquitination [Branchiostoma belcheri]|nr:protein ubiquitination [Branchiostoma belcheri]
MAAKLKKSNNIVVRLRLKEIRGSLQPHSHAPPVKMFNKTIPESLVFNLKDLLMEAEAHTGYPYYEYHLHWWVLRPVTPEQPGTTKRHFKLHKVSQVRLFGEEEIPTDIYLLVCQWPTDHNKVLVHGYSYHSGASTPSCDEKCLCYVTVTAVPPAAPCKDCLQLPQHLDPPDPEDSLSTPVPVRCLRHSFTLHTKYELAPPFPPFHPKVSLKLDGVIVLNTADSLVALSIKTGGEDKEQSIHLGGEGKEQSIHVGGGEEQSILSGGGDRELPILSGGGDRELPIVSGGGDRELPIVSGGGDRELPILCGGGDRELPILCGGGDGDMSIHTESGDREKSIVESRADGNVDAKLQCENSAATTSCEDQMLCFDKHLEMQSLGGNSSCVFNMKVHSGNQEHVEDKVGDLSQKCGAGSVNKGSCVTDTCGRCSTCAADDSSADDASGAARLDIFTGANSCNTCINTSSTGLSSSESTNCCPCFSAKENKSQSEERKSYTTSAKGTGLTGICEKKTAVPGTSEQCTVQTAHTRTLSMDSALLDNRDGELSSDVLSPAVCRNSTAQNLKTPEGYSQPSDLSTVSDSTTRNSTCIAVNNRTPEGHAQPSDLLSAASDSSSWDSTALDCSRSPCFTFTRRQYVYGTAGSGDHFEDTGESGSEYQSMLPLEVHGAGYSSMRLCMGEDKGSTYYGQPGSVEVQELRMDAEQVICDMARQDAEWGNRFVAFTDYDMQIIDVCPDSRQLVVLVLALVRARPHYGNCIPKLYQTSFTAAWDLNTGHHQTRDIQPLQEFDQAQLRKVWNPGRAMSRKMQQRWMIPQGYARGVHVMTNEAVFRGHSLSLLWDSTNCIAIVPGNPGR